MNREEIIIEIVKLTNNLSDSVQLAGFSSFIDKYKNIDYRTAPNDSRIIISTNNLSTLELLDLYKKLSIYSL